MRIGIISPSSEVGGAERSLEQMVRVLRSTVSARSEIGVYYPPGGRLESTRMLGSVGTPVEFCASVRRPGAFVRGLIRLADWLRRDRIDLLVGNNTSAASVVIPLARWLGIPAAIHVRDAALSVTPRMLLRLGKRTRIIANSHDLARVLELRGLNPRRIAVCYNAIDTTRFHPMSPEEKIRTRSKLGIPPDVVAVGMVGRLAKWKGVEEFLYACKEVWATSRGGLRCVIVGDDAAGDKGYKRDLNHLVVELGMDHYVSFLPFMTHVNTVVGALDSLAVPSHYEPFGRIALEGLASGVPVIASDVGGLRETLDGHATLVPPRDVSALATAIQTVLQNLPREQERAKSARTYVEERFGPRVVVPELLRTYESVYTEGARKRKSRSQSHA